LAALYDLIQNEADTFVHMTFNSMIAILCFDSCVMPLFANATLKNSHPFLFVFTENWSIIL